MQSWSVSTFDFWARVISVAEYQSAMLGVRVFPRHLREPKTIHVRCGEARSVENCRGTVRKQENTETDPAPLRVNQCLCLSCYRSWTHVCKQRGPAISRVLNMSEKTKPRRILQILLRFFSFFFF